jgi:hypothetical protein
MPTQFPTTSEPSLSTLVREIVDDVGDLIKQQTQFAQAEIKADLRKSREAVLLFGLGAGSFFLGLLFFGLMAVHLLHWLTAPLGTDPARVPLWGCYAIVAGLSLASSAVLIGMGKRVWDSFTAVPVQTAETIKENVEWITNSK